MRRAEPPGHRRTPNNGAVGMPESPSTFDGDLASTNVTMANLRCCLPTRRGRAGDRGATDRLRNGDAEQARDAAVAPVVHVQAVGREHGLERNPVALAQVAHDRETLEQADVAALGLRANEAD